MTAIKAYLTALADLIRRNPVATVAVVRSGVALVVAFWPGLVSPGQTEAILALAAALLGVDVAVHQSVTSTVAPKLATGTVVTVTAPDATPDRKVEIR